LADFECLLLCGLATALAHFVEAVSGADIAEPCRGDMLRIPHRHRDHSCQRHEDEGDDRQTDNTCLGLRHFCPSPRFRRTRSSPRCLTSTYSFPAHWISSPTAVDFKAMTQSISSIVHIRILAPRFVSF